MSGGAWSRGPPAWTMPTPQAQGSLVTSAPQSMNSIMNEQQNEQSRSLEGNSFSSEEKFKARRKDNDPWYPGKVNRNRRRGVGDKGPAQRKRMELPSASSSGSCDTKYGITVVNVHKKDLNKLGYKDLVEWVNNPDHLYIGRDMTVYVPGAVKSKWHNPFKSKQMGREQSCKQFKDHILTDKTIQSNGKTLFESLEELKGKTLGCWCHPEMCHGHVLRELVHEYYP